MQTNERASATDEVMPELKMEDITLDAIRLHGVLQGIEELLDDIQHTPSPSANAVYALMPVAVQKAMKLTHDLEAFEKLARSASK